MRLATYNIEWFSSLFDNQNELINDNSHSGRRDVTKKQQIKALGAVFKVMDADGIMIIEAPNSGAGQSSKVALENFARHFKLRQNKAIVGFENDTQQEIAFLYDPRKMDAFHDPQGRPSTADGSRTAPRFDGVFRTDGGDENGTDKVTFSKPPLELLLTPNGGKPLRLIGVHAKSKAPHGAKDAHEVVRISIENRRKQLAQCVWLRQRIDDHLSANENIIVMGDFNDGPGLDEYEKLFGQSGIEVAMGIGKSSDRVLREAHAEAAMIARAGAAPTTSRFYIRQTKTYLNALLDYIMVSPKLAEKKRPKWKIWHPFNTSSCYRDKRLCDALLTASDHFPVTLDLDFKSKG
ncbi:MAG: endonuclease [Rhodobacteraceae bacterium]|nr:MAG: endonuclease [Paracoccaceae bacterium]